jgi:hypothetical protein
MSCVKNPNIIQAVAQITAGCPVFSKGVQTYRPSQLQPNNSGQPPILIIPRRFG